MVVALECDYLVDVIGPRFFATFTPGSGQKDMVGYL